VTVLTAKSTREPSRILCDGFNSKVYEKTVTDTL
jgi:hypothetical protein